MINVDDYNRAVNEYSGNVYRFVFKTIRDNEATSDLVQDAFMKLWQHRDKVLIDKIKPWLFSVAHNAMINYLKTEAKRISLDETAIQIATDESDFDVKEIIEKSLQALPALDREIILLRDLEGYNYKEISEILKLSDSQVRVYLFRARKKIKDSVKILSATLLW